MKLILQSTKSALAGCSIDYLGGHCTKFCIDDDAYKSMYRDCLNDQYKDQRVSYIHKERQKQGVVCVLSLKNMVSGYAAVLNSQKGCPCPAVGEGDCKNP